MNRVRQVFDNFTLALIAVVAAATLAPAYGSTADLFDAASVGAIGLLFFLHGAKLSRKAIVSGAMHFRLHALVFGYTFVLFPILGWITAVALEPSLGAPLSTGLIYLSVLPGTVQSAIAFTSIARGNVPAAICSASASSLIGIFFTPLLLKILLDGDGGAVPLAEALTKIGFQLFMPFVAGHLLRPWIGTWIDKSKKSVTYVDQGSILLVVYTAFSASVIDGLWNTVPRDSLAILVCICCVLLAAILFITTSTARFLGLGIEDQIAAVFCGSKKSLATGVPMAQVLFPSSVIGPVLLPLMIFHQLQLMVCAVMARNHARRPDSTSAGDE